MLRVSTFVLALFVPALAYAHEVYVLPLGVIQDAMANPSPDPMLAYFGNEMSFFFWAFVALVVVSTIAAATFFRLFERRTMPVLMRIKRYALPLARVTAGISTLSFGFAGALYGTEMPFYTLFGNASILMQIFYVAAGISITLGIYTRPLAALLALVYIYAGYVYGWYVFTYTDHIGLYLLLILLGSGGWSLSRRLRINEMNAPSLLEHLRPLAFPILRILFGFGIMFASVYAKYIHSQLALDVVVMYDLTRFFPFDPLFVVLGALIIEFIAGVLFMLGFAVRWSAIFLLFWLTLSLVYFQEAVWPHIILFGLCGVVFLHGYDRFSVEGLLMRKRNTEPVL